MPMETLSTGSRTKSYDVDVFLSACIVMMFNTMAVKDKKALKKQLTASVKFKPSALAIFFFLHNPNQCSVSRICKDLNFIAF